MTRQRRARARHTVRSDLVLRVEALQIRAAVLLADAVRLQRAYEDPWREKDSITSTRLDLPDY